MKQLLIEARQEILTLRRTNEILGAKVEMIDLFALVLNTRPNYPSQGTSADVAWKLQREIDSIAVGLGVGTDTQAQRS